MGRKARAAFGVVCGLSGVTAVAAWRVGYVHPFALAWTRQQHEAAGPPPTNATADAWERFAFTEWTGVLVVNGSVVVVDVRRPDRHVPGQLRVSDLRPDWQTATLCRAVPFDPDGGPLVTMPIGFAHYDPGAYLADGWWRFRSASTPLWPAAAASAVGLGWAVRPRITAARRGRRGRCRRCGYDLRASPGRCPECGAAGWPSRTRSRPTHPASDTQSG